MALDHFPPAELTPNGRPILHPSEIEHLLLSSIDLLSEDTPSFPHFKSLILTLTNHRLIFLPPSPSPAFHIPLSSITHIFSPKKSFKSIFATPRVRFQVSTSPEGKIVNTNNGSSHLSVKSVVITLVVRGKGDVEGFVGKLWEVWRGRDWESLASSSEGGSGERVGVEESLVIRQPVVGLAGILRKEQEQWESTDRSLQDAFTDLNALMSKAKEMVMLAEKMRQKLLSGSNNQPTGTNDEEMGTKEEMQDWLLSVGIVSPVTKESAGALYHQQLARQLADFVKIPLERSGGTLNLIDVYCLFNRARGTELISPDDLLQACSLWEKIEVPFMLRKFDSGVKVIQNKAHSDDEVFSKIRSFALKADILRTGISASDAAMALGFAPALAKEYLLTAESKGLLCRDVSPDGFRFYINFYQEISVDDIYLVKDHGIYATWITASISR